MSTRKGSRLWRNLWYAKWGIDIIVFRLPGRSDL